MPGPGIRARHSVWPASPSFELGQETRAFAEMLNSGCALQLAADGVFREASVVARPPSLVRAARLRMTAAIAGEARQKRDEPESTTDVLREEKLERPSLVGPVMFNMFGNVIQVGALVARGERSARSGCLPGGKPQTEQPGSQPDKGCRLRPPRYSRACEGPRKPSAGDGGQRPAQAKWGRTRHPDDPAA